MASLDWFGRTFSSRQAVDDLLHPYVETGELSYHDLQLAKDFLPRVSTLRYQKLAVGFGASLLVCCYGRAIKRPPWGPRKLSFAAISTSVVALLYGGYREVSSHVHFIRSLDSPEAYIHALNDIKEKMGGPPGTFRLNEAVRRRSTSGSEVSPVEPEPGLSTVSTGPIDVPVYKESAGNDRWSQIRSSQSQNSTVSAPSSTWDVIRQGGLTERKPEQSRQQHATKEGEFEAMSDSERHTSSGSDDKS